MLNEQREVVAALADAGVLDGVRWAYRSAEPGGAGTAPPTRLDAPAHHER